MKRRAWVAFGTLLLTSCAGTPRPDRPDVASLGSNAAGEPCLAARNWRDPSVPDPFARAYAITCRTAAASRPVGTIRIVPDTAEALKPIEAVLACGPAREVRLASGTAQARQCHNAVLGTDTVRLDTVRDGSRIVADAAPALVAVLEEGVAILGGAKPSSADATRRPTASVDLAALAPIVPSEVATASAAIGFNPAAALSEGVDLNHKGLHTEASRVLNDALSRLPASTPPATRAELLLEVGLADSNIQFAAAAADHFAAADAVMADAPAARTAFLLRKREAYRALDYLNQNKFRAALDSLDRLARAPASAEQPLRDPATLRLLNQQRGAAGAVMRSIAVPDTAGLAQLALDAQAQWARSVALLALGDEAGSVAAIQAAANAYRPLESERIDRSEILWLGARIARQQGRLQVRQGKTEAALASFDRALAALRLGAQANAGTGNEPAIAEAELERASIFARGRSSEVDKRAAYARAVDALVASGQAAGTTTGMEEYLDILIAETRDRPQPDTEERFFRAIQAGGEPAVARQVTQLQKVVAGDPRVGSAVRERDELQREITRLRYRIATKDTNPDATPLEELERARDSAEQRLLAVDARLAADPRFRQVDDRPATLAELRAALRPGEAFLKLTELNRRIYALYADAERTMIYAVANDEASRRAVDRLAAQVRVSIDGRLDQGKLVPFDDGAAYALFRLIGGPAAERLARTRALVVDPGGPLERLPIGVLVTRYDPAAVRENPFDFSQTAFLATNTVISTALSPRSFLVTRALPASRARQPFLGLGEHSPPPEGAAMTAQVNVGFGCSVQSGQLASLSRAFKPISRRELVIAAEALGDPAAPMITDAAFSDTALQARGDLDRYEVLHFATHGLQEGQWGCDASPPALVTSFGDAGSDGLLSFSEIAALQLDANLVVLSACDTASSVANQALARRSGQEEAGGALEGLVRSFLTANARAVLATYWQVSAEEESDAFMRTFYQSARSQPIGGALHMAQRSLMQQPAFSHPFYWAPYFLVGDGAKPMLSTPIRTAAR